MVFQERPECKSPTVPEIFWQIINLRKFTGRFQMKDLKNMVEALRKGDQVLTQGGIIGKIHRVGDDGVLHVEIADGVKVKVLKHTIVQVMNKTEPAAAA